MSYVIGKIKELQENINSYKPFTKELLALWQEKLRIEWTYNSNAIEGNSLTYGETAFFLKEGLTSEGRPLKDYLEAKNHAEAVDYLSDVISGERQITEGFIKELHALLLRDIHFTYAKGASGKLIRKPLNAGIYKLLPNHVLTISGKIHKYTDPLHVKDEMEKLLKWLQSEQDLHVVEKAAIFHYRFVVIHPFDDGNGRMARLLMNLILMKAGFPPCVIKNVNRKKYLEALESLDAGGNYEILIQFIGEELLATQKMMLAVLEGRGDDLEYYSIILNRAERIDKILRIIGIVPISISQIMDKLPQIKRPTLKSDLKSMLNSGKIRKSGKGKGVLYFSN